MVDADLCSLLAFPVRFGLLKHLPALCPEFVSEPEDGFFYRGRDRDVFPGGPPPQALKEGER
jgi:hypothetical protein